MSPVCQDVALGREWLEFAEELVFSHSILSVEAVEREGLKSEDSSLEVLQAAYVTCILLNWEGSDTMKRRVRHHRFNAVVSVCKACSNRRIFLIF